MIWRPSGLSSRIRPSHADVMSQWPWSHTLGRYYHQAMSIKHHSCHGIAITTNYYDNMY